MSIDLFSHCFKINRGHANNDKIKNYVVSAAVATVVEVDVLTGELNIKSADILEETATAITPEVDIGQIEGGYVMGLGMWTTEKVKTLLQMRPALKYI